MSVLLFVSTYLLLLLASLSRAPAATARWQASTTPQGMLMEDKIRLGSTPPSCRNRCNACSPCMAVQVPTLPGGGGSVQLRPQSATTAASPLRGRSRSTVAAGPLEAAKSSNAAEMAVGAATAPLDVMGDAPYRSYPSYKPLGWKCRCGDHLYNP